ncbi:hypothetical protein [Streptomyces sp. WM6378]|uniref:hypothetical protein n=1 Tax=Streptomyces sp. WM6378 TaxID=1415557 RepID=UPI000A582404|nr:hypothetical protein [Streptomyces sp. WM6378]
MAPLTQATHRTFLSRRAVRATAAAAVLCASMALSACSKDSTADAKPTTTSSASSAAPTAASPSADPQSAEKNAVLAAYTGFWAEQVKAYAKADTKGTELKKYATLDALGQIDIDVARMQKAGTVAQGQPTHDSKVTALDASKKTPDATITDCLDISNWKETKAKTGQVIPFPSNQPTRYQTSASAEKWGNQWLITKVTTHGDQHC